MQSSQYFAVVSVVTEGYPPDSKVKGRRRKRRNGQNDLNGAMDAPESDFPPVAPDVTGSNEIPTVTVSGDVQAVEEVLMVSIENVHHLAFQVNEEVKVRVVKAQSSLCEFQYQTLAGVTW